MKRTWTRDDTLRVSLILGLFLGSIALLRWEEVGKGGAYVAGMVAMLIFLDINKDWEWKDD